MSLDKLREIVSRGAAAYIRMVEIGEGYGALAESDREAIDRYEELFDLSDDGAPASLVALLDVAEAADIRVCCGWRDEHYPGCAIGAALDRLREVAP